jgi:hypothetical protein
VPTFVSAACDDWQSKRCLQRVVTNTKVRDAKRPKTKEKKNRQSQAQEEAQGEPPQEEIMMGAAAGWGS